MSGGIINRRVKGQFFGGAIWVGRDMKDESSEKDYEEVFKALEEPVPNPNHTGYILRQENRYLIRVVMGAYKLGLERGREQEKDSRLDKRYAIGKYMDANIKTNTPAEYAKQAEDWFKEWEGRNNGTLADRRKAHRALWRSISNNPSVLVRVGLIASNTLSHRELEAWLDNRQFKS